MCGDCREDWVCLHPDCGVVMCSRYVNSHFLQHFSETGHCLGKSFSDLSVVCLQCGEYMRYEGEEATHLEAWEIGLYQAKFGSAPLAPASSSFLLDEVVRAQHDPRRDEADPCVYQVIRDAVQTQQLHAQVVPDRPASEAQLRSVVALNATAAAAASGPTDCCTVCREALLSEVIAQLPCGHVFHQACVLSWFRHSSSCPTCRSELPGVETSGRDE
mmetsp:Transcript_77921/g.210708  ORF Transcript_77921/g.210708 Transcript_77921/m.210708 type:complete len:216 (-) Transcript_77921:184-831(-)